jgi:RNA polymerase sigma-70 factor, ECF subfamily
VASCGTIRSFPEVRTKGAPEDVATAEGFLRGDAAAVALVDRWIAGAAASFRGRLAADWPDILQDSRLEVLRLLRASSWRGDSALKTYVWRVVAHNCIDALRRRRRRPVEELGDAETTVPSPDPSPLDRVLDEDARRRLLTALEAVPADCRQLWGSILRGLSYQEISREMGVAEGALRVRAHRCRKRAIEALGGNAAGPRVAQA